ncbi:hypothetical protein PchlR47_12835 [Pseudomonas chlororaphis]|nr:hypothetical protein PchlR47_12835 [Pseudomonas chlororaphis]
MWLTSVGYEAPLNDRRRSLAAPQDRLICRHCALDPAPGVLPSQAQRETSGRRQTASRELSEKFPALIN